MFSLFTFHTKSHIHSTIINNYYLVSNIDPTPEEVPLKDPAD
jgi:hypothetical protein